MDAMHRKDDIVLHLTQDEAWELLSRCLNSTEVDTDVSKEAIRKLAELVKGSGKTPLRVSA